MRLLAHVAFIYLMLPGAVSAYGIWKDRKVKS
jgi:hypothetical protein